MKRRKDKLIQETFSNDALGIDPAFKQKLRSTVMKRDQELNDRSGFNWRRYILAPLTAGAGIAVIVIAIASVYKPSLETAKQPFIPQKVSASELLQRSSRYYEAFDPGKYSFYVNKSHFEVGPGLRNCRYGVSEGHTTDFVTASYIYRDSQTGLQIGYVYGKYTHADNRPAHAQEQSYHIPNAVWPKSLDGLIPKKLQAPGTGGEFDPSVIDFVDDEGNIIENPDLSPVTVNGRDVFVFNTLPKHAKSSPDGCAMITRVILDAATYARLTEELYYPVIKPENLVNQKSFDITFSNPTEGEAIRIMSAAGFSRDKALDYIPTGSDGGGAGTSTGQTY
jgi:hypothetical protein